MPRVPHEPSSADPLDRLPPGRPSDRPPGRGRQLPRELGPVGAVVSAYRPRPVLERSVRVLVDQVSQVVVVDDGPQAATPESRRVLAACAAAGAQVLHQERNCGIAAALNRGIGALDPRVEAVVTLDQDSVVPAGYVDTLRRAYHQARREAVAAGMVAPASASTIRRLPTAGRRGGANSGVVIGGEPIQSGLLIVRAVLEAVGCFDEGLFIDGVDSDFYLRALDAGYVPVVAPVGITHQLGRSVRRRLGPLSLTLTVAATDRYYYQVRNLLVLTRRHARRHPGWCVRAVGKEARHLALVTALAPGRRQRLARALAGVCDGARGRTGRLGGGR